MRDTRYEYGRVMALIKNMPREMETGYIVARLCHGVSAPELWYYGTYETEERANEVALELENGVVLEMF